MSLWMVILIVVIGAWLAFKAVGLLVRLALWVVVLGALYWLLAPRFGLPMP
jgi:hypothetical protein